jgi:hypothetical protein
MSTALPNRHGVLPTLCRTIHEPWNANYTVRHTDYYPPHQQVIKRHLTLPAVLLTREFVIYTHQPHRALRMVRPIPSVQMGSIWTYYCGIHHRHQQSVATRSSVSVFLWQSRKPYYSLLCQEPAIANLISDKLYMKWNSMEYRLLLHAHGKGKKWRCMTSVEWQEQGPVLSLTSSSMD